MEKECSQPTYEELKPSYPPCWQVFSSCSQPTYEELKLGYSVSNKTSVDSSQPTYEELKRGCRGAPEAGAEAVLSLPMRN